MGFLIFLGCVVVIIVWAIVASEFRHIAAKKGYDEAKYFWFTFLFSIYGMLMVVALPDRLTGNGYRENTESEDFKDFIASSQQSVISFGSNRQDGKETTSIEWLVLGEKENKKLLVEL